MPASGNIEVNFVKVYVAVKRGFCLRDDLRLITVKIKDLDKNNRGTITAAINPSSVIKKILRTFTCSLL